MKNHTENRMANDMELGLWFTMEIWVLGVTLNLCWGKFLGSFGSRREILWKLFSMMATLGQGFSSNYLEGYLGKKRGTQGLGMRI